MKGVRASKRPCNETYRGKGPASEQEIQGVIDFTTQRAQEQEFAVFIDWHSYSQLWMNPWSYSAKAKPPVDADDQVIRSYYSGFVTKDTFIHSLVV